MTLTLTNLVHRFLYCFRRNSNGIGLIHNQERPTLFAKNYRTAQTLLFVDDEPSILVLRRLIFEAMGYSVLTAISGEAALETLQRYDVDAVVLDYLMPGMDGEETARRIRKRRSDIPIILSTGCLSVPERVLQVVTAAVEKGAKPEALIQVLQQHLTPLLHPKPNEDGEAYAY